jgi:hypothetical protein
LPFRRRKSICASGKNRWSFSIRGVANTTSPINAVCMIRNFCKEVLIQRRTGIFSCPE